MFTHLGHAVADYLRCLGISVILYLNDWLFHHPDRQVLLCNLSQLLNTQERSPSWSAGYPDSRYSVTSGSKESFTPRIQGLGDNIPCMQNFLQTSIVMSMSVPVHGLTQLGFRSHPSGSSAAEATTAHFHSLGTNKPVYTTASIRRASPCHPTLAMAGPIFSYFVLQEFQAYLSRRL